MSEQNWTPGPWEVTYEAGDFDESVGVSMDSHRRNPDHYRTAHLWYSDCEPGCEEAVANAHLIAAAPELYAALQLVMDDPESLAGRPRTAEKVAEAMAKARGEK